MPATVIQVRHARDFLDKTVPPEVSAAPKASGWSSTRSHAQASTEKILSSTETATLPRPSISSSPEAGTAPPARGGASKWLVVDTVNLSTTFVEDHLFEPVRSYPNCFEFCEREWPIVERAVFLILRQTGIHDCFWSFQERTAVPVNNPPKALRGKPSQWNQAWSPCPPRWESRVKNGAVKNKFDVTGFEYKCDHRVQTGCPCKLKITRDWRGPPDVYIIEVNDVDARHGCNHTLATNQRDSSMRTTTTPSLHAVLKVFIQRSIYCAGRPLPWSFIKEHAEIMCYKTKHLYCEKGHMKASLVLGGSGAPGKKLLSEPSCKHRHVLAALIKSAGMNSSRADTIRSGTPPTETWTATGLLPPYYHNLEHDPAPGGNPRYIRFQNKYHSIASQVLDGGLHSMHAHNFFVIINKQAERCVTVCPGPRLIARNPPRRLAPSRYTRRWNRILYHKEQCSSNLNSMWDDFYANNLRVRLSKSIFLKKDECEAPPPLDLWSWSLIGLVGRCYPAPHSGVRV